MATLFDALGSEPRMTVLGLFEPEGAELSAKEVAAKVGWPLSNTSYHVKILRNGGLIRTVREEPRRGAVEKYQGLTPAGRIALGLVEVAEGMV